MFEKYIFDTYYINKNNAEILFEGEYNIQTINNIHNNNYTSHGYNIGNILYRKSTHNINNLINIMINYTHNTNIDIIEYEDKLFIFDLHDYIINNKYIKMNRNNSDDEIILSSVLVDNNYNIENKCFKILDKHTHILEALGIYI
ncbi:hypothetical protein CHREV_066 [Choristoneura rosaceana entomopoxvirus 'L']|uniref:N1R/p28-like protein n=1 Tax=Choristoneura rosaceana entomopoxvirus 'L' TaxID=1293539 RepID=A0ABM9QK98_9POXV|nr:hypothetical protein CHREV_066 [Choristoneura rosaceana entomopoxvirus 'L']CCU55968.1 hypothetical protein CHREV_066 [Choristoneura rosaceana entomopoxvirus 'L']